MIKPKAPNRAFMDGQFAFAQSLAKEKRFSPLQRPNKSGEPSQGPPWQVVRNSNPLARLSRSGIFATGTHFFSPIGYSRSHRWIESARYLMRRSSDRL
jgi:hypothetical protein